MLKMTVTGTLGKDAEIREVGTTKVINFSLAVNTGYGDKKKTIWIDVSKFGEKTAVAEYLKKGTKVLIDGEPDLREYDKKDGTKATSLTLRVNELELLGGNNANAPVASSQPSTAAEASQDLPF